MLASAFVALLALAAGSVGAKHHPNRRGHRLHHERDVDLPKRNSTIGKRSYSGTGTYFYVDVAEGACGGWSSNSDYMVALNSNLYGSGYPGPECWKYICIEANGNTICGIQIRDECPSCPDDGDLDLSPGLFQQYADLSAGVLSITWWYQDDSTTTTSSATPTTTWTPTTTSTQAWTPSTTSSSTPAWTPTPSSSSSTWTPTSTSSSSTSSSTSSSSSSSSSSSITSSGANSTVPLNVISTDSASASATASVSADGSGSDSTTTSIYAADGNLVLLNGVVANVGGLVVAAAGGY